MTHILDRPIWNALKTRHAHLAEGGPLALRYPASVSAFAATGDDRPESFAALPALAERGQPLILVQAGEIAVPPGMVVVSRASLVQMVATQPLPSIADARVEPLGPGDAQAMFDLAQLTKPGPFTLGAQRFGAFWGVKVDGRLIAMAGQRMKQPGFTELSGVCVHPDFQGRGLGRLMSAYGAGKISEAGDQPYLHAYATNTAAIRLYESIGFRLRSPMNAAIFALEE